MAALLKQFQVGQRVILKELDWGYELTILPGRQEGLEVVEIGRDYLVVADADTGVSTRLPLHTIRLGAVQVATPPISQVA